MCIPLCRHQHQKDQPTPPRTNDLPVPTGETLSLSKTSVSHSLSLLAIDTGPTLGHCHRWIGSAGSHHRPSPTYNSSLSHDSAPTHASPPLSDRTIPSKKITPLQSPTPRLGTFLQKEHPISQGGNHEHGSPRHGHRHRLDNLQGVLWRSMTRHPWHLCGTTVLSLILCVTICDQSVPSVHWDQLICPQFTLHNPNFARILSTSMLFYGTH